MRGSASLFADHVTADSGSQGRVFAEIERYAALPWWRNSFAHWPIAARVGFLIASYGFLRLALAAAMWVGSALRSAQVVGALHPAERWLHGSASIISVAADVGASVIRAVPPNWLYGAVAAALVSYAVLFGLGSIFRLSRLTNTRRY